MIQDKALEIITRGPITYDGLRAELGCTPGELDTAIRSLETIRAVTRDRGRLRLITSNGLSHQVAQAQSSTNDAAAFALGMKTCRACQVPKPLEDFTKHPETKDGKDPYCRECKNRMARERRQAKVTKAQPVPPVSPAVVKAGAARTPVVILHLPDGVRVGPTSISAAGVMQMPYHVDLTGEQLDEICAWWTNSKRGGE